MLILVSSNQPAHADTSSGGDGASWLLLFGGTIVTGINLLTIGLSAGRDGSEVLGIAGAVIGTSLVTYSYVKDVEDAGFFAAGGAVVAVIGLASFSIAREHKKDAKVSGLHITPCVVPGSEHATGLELSYRW
jgi:hypothetical protein